MIKNLFLGLKSRVKRKLSTALVLSLFLASIISSVSPAGADTQIVKLNNGIEVSGTPFAMAANKTHFVTVGEVITIQSFEDQKIISIPNFGSEQIFTDVIAVEDRFIAVGVLESVVVSSKASGGNFINPESITINSEESRSYGLTRLKILEFNSEAVILKEFIYESATPIFPKSIQVISSEIYVTGEIANFGGFQGFIAKIDLNTTSIFLQKFGSINTSINRMVNAKTAYGASRESIGGSKLEGLSDGVIFFLKENLELSRIVRSFASSSLRDWRSVSVNHLAVGVVEKSGKSEVAATKFNKNGSPRWTNRIPGASQPFVDGVRIGLITKRKISFLPEFAPKRKTALFLIFNKQGVIKAASTIPALALRDLNDGYALIQLQRGGFQLIRLAP